ncbi:UNVERIFIED_CONTAM: protein phosphatase 1 regulatory inhibitor subunit PPP1R7 [Sesamum calycinum]|uniref:Protein phosphatase 1 regulatory inhibitor subunit PPP1R7 n=1 Tax=Sesamum calycinum TaxID=2727403 RepID=A0AAW2NVZ1_9LAMI
MLKGCGRSNIDFELVLRDNQLKKIPDVSIFKVLLVFDVSFNEISSLSGLSKVSNTLKELYVSKNEVTKIEEIEHFHQLQILELGSNKLRAFNSLHLFIPDLKNLHLNCAQYQTLQLCNKQNKLMERKRDKRTLLEDLWLNDNQITSLDSIAEAVASSRENLTTIYLERNPCANSPNYISTLRQIFPKIQQIDSEIFG